MGIDGWLLNARTEKNKLAPSGYSVPLIFDKKFGIIPFWSEYYFLANKTKTELKYWPQTKVMPYPLTVVPESQSRVLKVIDPTTKNVLFKTEKFTERRAFELYNTDANFRNMFDKAVDIAVEQRININLFRNNLSEVHFTEEDDTDGSLIPDDMDD